MAEIGTITQRRLIETAAERWARQYPPNRYPDESQMGAIRRRLMKEAPRTHEAVAAIIGNESWTRITCDVCENPRDTAVVIDTASDTQTICADCLEEMRDKLAAAIRDQSCP